MSNADLLAFMRTIAADHERASAVLSESPELATSSLEKAPAGTPIDEVFLAECGTQIYVGDTALHVAAAAYDVGLAERLVDLGADVRARNRRARSHSTPRRGAAPGRRSGIPPARWR